MAMRGFLYLQILLLVAFSHNANARHFLQSLVDKTILNYLGKSIGFCPDLWPKPTHVDPEIYENASQIIKSYGYPCETHQVHTKDGYILTLFRIPHGKNSQRNRRSGTPRPAFFLQHGLLDSAHTWINNMANESFAFILADKGYDVWLGNSRGNTYSMKHETLSPHSAKFWAFSWDEMAAYDLPACVDHVLKVTSLPSLYYVGHSQGTVIAFAQLSQDTALASKIKHFFALGPVTNVSHIESPIKLLVPFASTLEEAFQWFGNGEFLPHSYIVELLAQYLCGGRMTEALCRNVVFLFAGYDCKYTNETRLPVYLAHTPAGTSVTNLAHYVQGIKSKQFQKFDYGKEENQKRYNQSTPPLYDVNKITTPVSLYWGAYDWLADPADVRELIPRLKSLKESHYITDYNHLDFVWAYNAKTVIYDKIIRAVQELSNYS